MVSNYDPRRKGSSRKSMTDDQRYAAKKLNEANYQFGRGPRLDKVGEEIENYETAQERDKRFAAGKIEERFVRGKVKGGIDAQLLEERNKILGKLPVFILFVIGGIAMVLGSLRITGNVVSDLTKTAPGLLGAVFFIAGIVGLFSYRRR